MRHHRGIDPIVAADAAVEFAQEVRKRHRRRTERGTQQRKEDIEAALKRIREAMKPLRSDIGRFPYLLSGERNSEHEAKVRAASLALQKERRKLFKMKDRRRERSF